MIEACQDLVGEMENGKDHDFLHQMNCITFNILTNVLFGDDVNELKTEKRPYLKADGQWEPTPFFEGLLLLGNSFLLQLINPITTMFPFINKYDLINPYKRDKANLINFTNLLKEIVYKSKDTKSVSYKVFKESPCTKQEIFEDLLTYMVAGSETSARTMVSAMYYMKKNPDILVKVKEELKSQGLVVGANFKEVLTMEVIQNLDYLTAVIKEALRMDSPTFESFTYMNYEDITLCDIPIPKGTQFKIDIATAHYYENMWLKPGEFRPERFDMDSDFYKEQKEKCPDNSNYSRRAFSQGKRACPGQTLAYLEIKIILSYLITYLDYDIDEEFLNRYGVGFGLGCETKPMFTIHKN